MYEFYCGLKMAFSTNYNFLCEKCLSESKRKIEKQEAEWEKILDSIHFD